MNTTSEISKSISELAESIDRADKNIGNLLRQLAKAIEVGSPEIDAWAAIDLFSCFSVKALASSLNPASHHNLEQLRNALVFLPLVMTWGILGFGTGRNGGLGDITFIAILNVVLFLLLIYLTYRVNKSLRMRNERLQQDELRIGAILHSAALFLAGKRTNQPIEYTVKFESIGNNLISQIDSYRKKIEELATEKHNELANLRVFSDNFVKGSDLSLKASKRLGDSVNQINSSVVDLNQHINALVLREQSMVTMTSDIANQLAKINAKHADLLKNLESNSVRLQSAADSFSAAQSKASPMLQYLSDTASGLANVHKDFLDRMARQLQEQQSVSTSVKNILDQAGKTAPILQQANQSVSLLPAAITNASDALATLATKLFELSKQHDTTITLIQQANAAVRDSKKDLK